MGFFRRLAAAWLVACWAGTAAAQVALVDMASRQAHPPAYPPGAVAAGIEGTTILRVLIDAAGQLEAIEVERGSGHAPLDAAAVEAARRWRYHPAHANGQPIPASIRVPVDFYLEQ